MTGRLAGKVALVTGAASGIGRATAARFVREGAVVGLADLDMDGAEKAAAECDSTNALPLRVDVTDEASLVAGISHLVETAGRFDVAVANAGVQLFGRDAEVCELPLDVWRQTIDVNLTGTFLTVKHAGRAMRRAGSGGSVIVTGSPTGIVGSGRGFTAYSTSKAGIHGLVRIAAADCAPYGIRVNTVVPGYTETPLVQAIRDDPEQRGTVVGAIPLARAGTPADVEGIMVYLASDESAFATGAMFVVDGGATAV